MYTSFFGLNEKPFTITPDPRYLFMSERHGEGLAHLVYGVTDSGGFIQLTGEVGTGKTMLVRTLLGQLPSEVDIALILNPQLTALEFLITICEELGANLPKQQYSAKALVDALNQHLLNAHSQGRRTILLVDEAQKLSEGVLEQLRLLTNLETAKRKLLQIILIAQPELRDKLAKENMRQLAQRVTGRYHLEPLSNEEALKYIDHRLRVAGALREIFEPAAKREVFRLSGGVPRLINVICDRSLLGAYSQESRTISKRLVRKAASEISGQAVRPSFVKWLIPIVTLSGIVLTGALFWMNSNKQAPILVETVSETSEIAKERIEAGTNIDHMPEAVSTTKKTNFSQIFVDYDDQISFETLFKLWNVDYDSTAGTACAQAEEAGLRCYFQRGTWATIRQLDRPVILTLIADNGLQHGITLISLDEEYAQLAQKVGSVDVLLTDLSDYWYGQFMLIWRPANGRDEAIGPGMRNENVRWLRESLAIIDKEYQPTAEDTDVFDAELGRQLIAFQRKYRLEADGLAGRNTQIIINSLLAGDGTPRLSPTK